MNLTAFLLGLAVTLGYYFYSARKARVSNHTLNIKK